MSDERPELLVKSNVKSELASVSRLTVEFVSEAVDAIDAAPERCPRFSTVLDLCRVGF